MGPVTTRVVAPTMAAAATTSAIAVVVNLATEWKTNPWAWIAVGAFTLISAAVSLWLYHRSGGQPSTGDQLGAGAVKAGRDIRGNVSTTTYAPQPPEAAGGQSSSAPRP